MRWADYPFMLVEMTKKQEGETPKYVAESLVDAPLLCGYDWAKKHKSLAKVPATSPALRVVTSQIIKKYDCILSRQEVEQLGFSPMSLSFFPSTKLSMMARHDLLCLNCRQEGHIVEKCSTNQHVEDPDRFFSSARRQLDLAIRDKQKLCPRCESLDLTNFFDARPPWNTQLELTDKFDEKGDAVRDLGFVATVEFQSGCPVCCCLFAISPQPSSLDQKIFLVPDWSVSRLSGELGVVTMDRLRNDGMPRACSRSSNPVRIPCRRGLLLTGAMRSVCWRMMPRLVSLLEGDGSRVQTLTWT